MSTTNDMYEARERGEAHANSLHTQIGLRQLEQQMNARFDRTDARIDRIQSWLTTITTLNMIIASSALVVSLIALILVLR